MKAILFFLLSLTLILSLYIYLGGFLAGLPILYTKSFLSLVFLFLSGFFLKYQRYFLAVLCFLVFLALTSGERPSF